MYNSDYPDYDFDGCEKCGAALSIGMHFCSHSEVSSNKTKSTKDIQKAPKKRKNSDDYWGIVKDPFESDGPDATNRPNFLEEERNRLIKKLQAIEVLANLAVDRIKDNPEEVREILRQIIFHSK